MRERRRRCITCNKLTKYWQRINGGPWHCYDGCYSTTGADRRTLDGRPLYPEGYWDLQLTEEESAARKTLRERLMAALKTEATADNLPHPAEQIISEIMNNTRGAEQLLESAALSSSPTRLSVTLLALLSRVRPFDEHWRARMIYLCLRSDSPGLRNTVPALTQAWGITPRPGW